MIIRPDLDFSGNQYDDYINQYENKEVVLENVKENFDIRRKHSNEGKLVKIGIGDTWYEDYVIIQESGNPLHQEYNERQVLVPFDIEFKRGMYLYDAELDEYWLIFSERRSIANAYWSTKIRLCNYKMKWIDTVTRRLVEMWIVIMSKNSYSSGVWWNTFGSYVDSETACAMPTGMIETERIKRGDRRIISNKTQNVKTFTITDVSDIVFEGMTILNFEESNFNELEDDKFEKIADRWVLELDFDINVLNGDNLQINQNDSYYIKCDVTGFNKLHNESLTIKQPDLEFTSADEDVFIIDENGKIEPISNGTSELSVVYKDIDGYVRATKTILIEIVTSVIENYALDFKGNSVIYFDGKANYTINLLKNGKKEVDTFVVELLDEFDNPINKNIAEFKMIDDNSFTVFAKEENALINIKITSDSTSLSVSKLVMLKDIL